MGITHTEATTPRISAEDEKDIQRVLEHWKQSFRQLRTLDTELECTALIDNGNDANNRPVFKGKFVYDEPRYYIQMQPADNKGALGDMVKEAYDGHYYWGKNRQDGHDYIIKSVNDPSSPLPSSINPIITQFAFAFNTHEKKTLATLKKAETWESLKRRIIRIDKTAPNDKNQSTFVVENREEPNSSGSFRELYKVRVTASDTPFPLSWKNTSTQSPKMEVEFTISDTKRYSQGALQFFFPIRFNTLAYSGDTLVHNYETNISEATLKINRPVDSTIFAIVKDENTEVINVDYLDNRKGER